MSSRRPEPGGRGSRRATVLLLAALVPLLSGVASAAEVASAVSASAQASATGDRAIVAESSASAAARALAAAEVASAARTIAADPALGGSQPTRTWRFKRDDAPKKSSPKDLEWLADLRRWLAEGGRAVVWLAGIAAIALLVVGTRRWWAAHGAALGTGARLPTHVRDLDIRPESLPADVGAAVREAWLAGERRLALSLLYRGALSRLVHGLAVPIADSSTEGDCVRLAEATLPPERSAFVARLIGAWQQAVYGQRQLPTPLVLALCDEFDRQLPAARPTAGAAPA